MLSSLERLLLHARSRSRSQLPAIPMAGRAAAASVPLRAFVGLRHLSRATAHPHHLSWEGRGGAVLATTAAGSSRGKDLVGRLELALKARHVDEAWVAFDALRASGGGLLPPQALISGLITASSYSSDAGRLRRAFELAVALSRKRTDLLHYDSLARLALVLARSQMPEPAATVLRLMLERGKLPPAPVWSSAFSHMVKSPVGSHLASGILIELCECFTQCPLNSKRSKLTKPGTALFNLVLDSCLRHGSPLQAQHLIDLMPKTGVVADAHTITAIARVYEMNGHREDLKRLKLLVYSVPSSPLLDRHYQHVYACLLSLHFKFSDIAAAAELVLDLYQRPKLRTQQSMLGKHGAVQLGSGNLNSGCKMLIDPTLLGCDLVAEPECQFGLIMFTDRGLRPSNTTIAKLIHGFVRLKRVGELSRLLVSIHNAVQVSAQDNLISEVILACVELGRLETAHDILDDMESAGVAVPEATYASLLTAYAKQNLLREAKVLLRQMRKGGMLENLADGEAISLCLSEELPANNNHVCSVSGSCLAKFLNEETREDDGSRDDHLTYEFNSSISFFCKVKMMEDAVRAFRKMHERKVQPTVQTFSHLINGYSSLEAYRETAMLWGEIRRRLDGGALLADRDLFECLLWSFIRGGYFERAMEIVSCIAKHGMDVDKWKFKREFLRLHKNLYRNLSTSDARTDAQSGRLEHVRVFRRWVGIDTVRGMDW